MTPGPGNFIKKNPGLSRTCGKPCYSISGPVSSGMDDLTVFGRHTTLDHSRQLILSRMGDEHCPKGGGWE